MGKEIPETPLMDRIMDSLDNSFGKKGNEKTAKYIYDAITTGKYTEMMRPANKTSRKLFTDLTGVKLPPSERDTKLVFTGKPFDVLPEHPKEKVEAPIEPPAPKPPRAPRPPREPKTPPTAPPESPSSITPFGTRPSTAFPAWTRRSKG